MLKIVLIVSIPFSLLLVNLHFLITKYFVQFNYELLGFGGNKEKLSLATKVVESIRSVSDERRLETGVFTEREIQHLSDVKNLVITTLRVHLLSVVLSVASTLILSKEKVSIREIKRCYYIGLFLTFAVIALFGLIAVLDFNLFFTKFHRMFFTGESWLFLPSDTLIQLFPLEFWINSTKALLILVVIEVFLALFLVYKFELTKAKFNKLINQLIIR